VHPERGIKGKKEEYLMNKPEPPKMAPVAFSQKTQASAPTHQH
jgi:hypothetical protein